ncbi:MAG: ABC transporter substrate-binding protein [Firmicutes bacterium]|nr:ABC transporter substrate-binding protein [Bacillota bacterium]
MKVWQKIRSLWIIGALFALVVSTVVSAAGTTNTLKIGFLTAEDELPLYVGVERGDFARGGVDLQLVTFVSAVERDTALRAGQVDGIVCDLIALGLFAKGRMDVKATSISLGATPGEGRFALLAGPNSGVEKISDLKGVPVGISNNSIIEFVNYQLLKAAGFADSEIKTVEIPKVPVRVELLLKGQIKAATLPDPFASLAEAQGAKLLASDTDSEINLSPIVYIFSSKTIKEKKAVLERFYQIYSDIVTEINANPEAYRSYMVEYCKVPKAIEEVYPVPTFSLPTLPTKAEWELVMDWMVAKGMLKTAFPYEQYFDASFVKQ